MIFDSTLLLSKGQSLAGAAATTYSDNIIDLGATGAPYGTLPSGAAGGAMARDIGSRLDNKAAQYLYDVWLPRSGEAMADGPLLFHYVNVGPNVGEHEAITDVYLPLK